MGNDGLDHLYAEHLATLSKRAEHALAAAQFDAMVVHSGTAPVQFLDDQSYPYKVNPQFKAWVPITDNPGSVVVIAPARRPKLLLHQARDYWHKPAPMPDAAWTAQVEVVAMEDPAASPAEWAGLGRIAYIGPPGSFGAAAVDALNPPELLKLLHHDRAVKTAYELECLRRANQIGARGHRAALAAFRAGASEYTVHMRYLEACGHREEELPYNNIVAYNENAAVLHYQRLEHSPPRPLRSFLIDAGAQYRGYAADITRTHAAATGAFADLVAAVDEAQLLLCDEIRPDKDYREVHLTAHRLLGDVLHRVGLSKLGGQDALEAGLTAVFFPHGIGHLLGLQVHDVGGVLAPRPQGHPYLRLTRMLEPGVVVTVEPGIYFIDSLLEKAHSEPLRAHIDWSLVEALRPYGGIRIEDNVATTAAKPENLTRDAFAGLAA
jgi:Xaa-Pro dipeptidase